jgi:hydroxyacylglutathione hydrolase
MRCFINFSLSGFSNCYLIGPDDGGDAIVIDPGEMNIKLLNLIEDNNFYIKHILITHNHKPHIGGIKTLLKIYDAEIYSSEENILGYPSNLIHPNSTINLSGIEVKVMEFSGQTKDTLIYKVEEMLFTGDTLGAGSIGEWENKNTIALVSQSISKGIKKLDDSRLVFPSHGPPSTIKAEKDFNPELFLYE